MGKWLNRKECSRLRTGIIKNELCKITTKAIANVGSMYMDEIFTFYYLPLTDPFVKTEKFTESLCKTQIIN